MTVRLIRQTAKEIAGAFYEGNRSERFRASGISQKQFVAQEWPNFVEVARATLAQMLGLPGTPEHQKREIYEALLEDHQRQEIVPHARSVVGPTLH